MIKLLTACLVGLSLLTISCGAEKKESASVEGAKIVTAQLSEMEPLPDEKAGEYKDLLTFTFFETEQKERLQVVLLVIENYRYTEFASIKAGDTVELELVPLRKAPRKVGNYDRNDELEELKTPAWFASSFKHIEPAKP